MRSSKYGLGLAIAATCMGFGANAASADTYGTKFEAPAFTTGDINGQDGWTKTNSNLDAAVASNGAGVPAVFGSQSLRISNAFLSGGFGDQTFSKSLTNEAGEDSADAGTMSGGLRQTRFVTQWKFTSASPGAEQPGLYVVASPDRGDGARMSRVEIADSPNGLDATFTEYDEDAPGDNPGDPAGNFVDTQVADGLARGTTHTVRIEMDFVSGRDNDVVKVYIDGQLKVTGGSWEDYFRDVEVNPTRTVDSVLFRTGGGQGETYPGNRGKGILIDDFVEESSSPTSGPQGNPGTPGGTGTQGPAGATGPQGPAGAQGVTPSSTPTTGKVSLVSKSLKAGKNRKVSVSVSCPRANGLCEGRLNLILKGKTISRTVFEVRGGRSGKITVTLSKKAYKALKKSQKVRVNVFSRDLAGTASSAGKTLTLKK